MSSPTPEMSGATMHVFDRRCHSPKSATSFASTVSALKYVSAMARAAATMPCLIRVDPIKSRQDLFHRGKRKQPFAGGEKFSESGVLGDDGTPGCKIASAAIAKPAAAKAYVLILGDRKLAARV